MSIGRFHFFWCPFREGRQLTLVFLTEILVDITDICGSLLTALGGITRKGWSEIYISKTPVILLQSRSRADGTNTSCARSSKRFTFYSSPVNHTIPAGKSNAPSLPISFAVTFLPINVPRLWTHWSMIHDVRKAWDRHVPRSNGMWEAAWVLDIRNFWPSSLKTTTKLFLGTTSCLTDPVDSDRRKINEKWAKNKIINEKNHGNTKIIGNTNSVLYRQNFVTKLILSTNFKLMDGSKLSWRKIRP